MRSSIGRWIATRRWTADRRATDLIIALTILFWCCLLPLIATASNLWLQYPPKPLPPSPQAEQWHVVSLYDRIWHDSLPLLGAFLFWLAPIAGYSIRDGKKRRPPELRQWWRNTVRAAVCGLAIFGLVWLESRFAIARPGLYAKWVTGFEFVLKLALVATALSVPWILVRYVAIPLVRVLREETQGGGKRSMQRNPPPTSAQPGPK